MPFKYAALYYLLINLLVFNTIIIDKWEEETTDFSHIAVWTDICPENRIFSGTVTNATESWRQLLYPKTTTKAPYLGKIDKQNLTDMTYKNGVHLYMIETYAGCVIIATVASYNFRVHYSTTADVKTRTSKSIHRPYINTILLQKKNRATMLYSYRFLPRFN